MFYIFKIKLLCHFVLNLPIPLSFLKGLSTIFLKAYPKECMLFHWNIYEIYSNCCSWYLTYLLFCLFLLFLDNILLFILCVPVFGTMIGVLIPFIFHSDLECRHTIFLLVIAAKFFKSYVNLYFTKYQSHEWNKTLDSHYVILGIWKVFTIPSPSSIHWWPLLL